jgi:hypothetical protein
VYICKPSSLLPRSIKQSLVIFLSAKDLKRNLNKLNEKRVYLVFDSAVTLSKYMLHYMDMVIGDRVHLDGFIRKDAAFDLDVPDLEFTNSHFDVILHSVAEVKAQRTLLNQLMTFIYTLPRSSHQKPVKVAICSWLPTRYGLPKLFSRLKALSDSPLTEKHLERLGVILTSETANIYRQALQEGGDSDLLAEKYQISAYEINYIRAINTGS